MVRPSRATPVASEIAVEFLHGRSVVSRSRSSSPLRLLSPRSTGRAAWVFQSSLGGGFVGEDDVAVRADVAAGASLFLSSQSSTKVYRAARSRFTLDASVGDDATLVAWPDPIVCFAGAAFDQVQRFHLSRSASLVVVDAWTAGRVARGERWAFDHLATRLTVDIAGAPVLDDAMWLANAHGDLRARLGDTEAFATIVVAGGALAGACDRLAERIAGLPLTWPLVAASRWPWGMVLRLAAGTTEVLARTTRDLLHETVMERLGADPWLRKW